MARLGPKIIIEIALNYIAIRTGSGSVRKFNVECFDAVRYPALNLVFLQFLFAT